jgi:hypothetical protein
MPTEVATTTIAPTAGIRFTVASRPQRRFSNTQTVSNLAGATSFAPIPLPATGFVRKLGLKFVESVTSASAGAVVAGDGPWNSIAGITLTDATGQPVYQPLSGYNVYLIDKYLGSGVVKTNVPRAWMNPHLGPEFAYASTATVGTAVFRLDLDFEQDYDTGYGCIPNLDSNASLQLKVDVAASTVAFSGTTTSAATVALTVDQWYWAPVGAATGGIANRTTPVGYGDFVETRYENQAAVASAENTVPVNNRGGMVKGIIAVSRAAGVRTAFTAATNVGVVYDNNAIDEGIKLETQQDLLRRTYGYLGTDLTTSYAPLTAGVLPGLETGVMVFNFGSYSAGRDAWLSTRVGTLLQLKITPGAAATQMELVTQLAQVKDAEAFYLGGY